MIFRGYFSVFFVFSMAICLGIAQDVAPPDLPDLSIKTTTKAPETQETTTTVPFIRPTPRHISHRIHYHSRLCDYRIDYQGFCYRCCPNGRFRFRCCKTSSVWCMNKYGSSTSLFNSDYGL
uniref:Putative secreted protein n=1 Tax=Lutzomyia longipalpis TaxID=7200 RepID=A0A7G3ALJ5_LUTLO